MLSAESQFNALGPSPAGGLSFPALPCPTVGIFISHRRKPGQERDSALSQQRSELQLGSPGAWAPSLDRQDKSEEPGLGLEGLMERQGATLPENSEEEGICEAGWASVGLYLGSYSLLALTPWLMRPQMSVP